MLYIILNIFIKKCLKILIIQIFLLKKRKREIYFYIYYLKFISNILKEVLLNIAIKTIIFIYLVIDT